MKGEVELTEKIAQAINVPILERKSKIKND